MIEGQGTCHSAVPCVHAVAQAEGMIMMTMRQNASARAACGVFPKHDEGTQTVTLWLWVADVCSWCCNTNRNALFGRDGKYATRDANIGCYVDTPYNDLRESPSPRPSPTQGRGRVARARTAQDTLGCHLPVSARRRCALSSPRYTSTVYHTKVRCRPESVRLCRAHLLAHLRQWALPLAASLFHRLIVAHVHAACNQPTDPTHQASEEEYEAYIKAGNPQSIYKAPRKEHGGNHRPNAAAYRC